MERACTEGGGQARASQDDVFAQGPAIVIPAAETLLRPSGSAATYSCSGQSLTSFPGLEHCQKVPLLEWSWQERWWMEYLRLDLTAMVSRWALTSMSLQN